jgi:hypothetical protein
VSRIDLKIDIPGVLPHQLHIDATDIRCSQINNGVTGLMESMHLGTRKSPLFINVYQKQDNSGKDMTRIECRMKRLSRNNPNVRPTLSNLHLLLQNPFQRLRIYKVPNTPQESELINLVLAATRSQGLKSALQMLDPKSRNKVRQVLADHKYPLFDAEKVWAGLPAALSALDQLQYID